MFNQQYPWKRRWIPQGTPNNYDSRGFATSLGYSYGQGYISKGVLLAKLDDIECVILLGDPGTGKTTEIENDSKRSFGEYGTRLSELVFLNTCSTSEDLRRTLDRKISKWTREEGNFYLYLDGLDEGMLNFRNVFLVIKEWIKETNGNTRFIGKKLDEDEENSKVNFEKADYRLFLRISCRSAIWMRHYTDSLSTIFGDENVKVYELAPLEQEDVRIAAIENNIDPEQIVESIANANFGSLAGDPVSLGFLITAFKKGTLQHSGNDKKAIFYDGLLQLSKEKNPFYIGYIPEGIVELSGSQRFMLASRIAAYTTFSNKNSIAKVFTNLPVEIDSLVSENIVGDFFKLENTAELNFSTRTFYEVLNTGLFSLGASQDLLVWKHKTYSEFLAAWHLKQVNCPLEQVLQLVCSPDDPERTSPQVQNVVLWLVAFYDELFKILISNEPELALKSHRRFTYDDKENIVDSLLGKAYEKELFLEWNDYKYLKRLKFSGLNERIKSVLGIKEKKGPTLDIALNLIASCNLSGLKDELMDVLLDVEVPIHLRRLAMEGLSDSEDEDVVKEIKSYILNTHKEDKEDELKGQAIQMLYPGRLTTKELIGSLTKPKSNSFGFYKMALDKLAEKIPEEDLPIAIQNIINKDIFFDNYGHDFEDLLLGVMNRGWNSKRLKDFKIVFASLIIKLSEEHSEIGLGKIIEDEARREVVFEIIAKFSKKSNADFWPFQSSVERLIKENDWEWLAHLVEDENLTQVFRENAAEILVLSFSSSREVKILNRLFGLGSSLSWFKGKYESWLVKCDLGSKESERKKAFLERERNRLENKKALDQEPTFDPLEKALSELKAFEEGDNDGWRRMIHYMHFSADGKSRSFDLDADIKTAPIWGKIKKEDQQRIRLGAFSYLKRFNLEDSQGYDNYSVLAGYKALHFLISENVNNWQNISDSTLRKWLPVMVCYSLNGFGTPTPIGDEILKKAYQFDKNSLLNAFKKQLVIFKNSKYLERIEVIIDGETAPLLFSWIKNNVINEEQRKPILNALSGFNPNGLFHLLDEELKKIGNDKFDLLKVIDFSVAILKLRGGDWSSLWKLIVKDSDFGKKLITGFVTNPYFKFSYLQEVSPFERADLVIWLYKNFPKADDESNGEAHFKTSRDYVGELRQQLLGSLIGEGTKDSLQALQFLVTQVPDLNSDWMLFEARKKVVENNYVPLSPDELRNILQNGEKRLVRSSEELLKVILESLNRFQDKLKGNNPVSYFLWDKQRNGEDEKSKFLHKDENAFSDFVKMHLDYDLQGAGIIVNREVEIKKSTGKGTGERTDIFIQVSNPEYFQKPFTVVVEAKGCWHSELKTAMETQLIGRYLEKRKSDCGIFLVGWFHGENFLISECTHQECISRDDLESLLNSQAKSLSTVRITVSSVVLDCSLNDSK